MKLATLYERDYHREYKLYHGKPESIRNRSDRNIARRKLGLKKGDGLEVQHNKPLAMGGTNSDKNLSITQNKRTQRAEGNKVKYASKNRNR